MARHLKYKNKAELQESIDAYFVDCNGKPLLNDDGSPVFDKYGHPIITGMHPPTITGLALALGFAGRQALINYQGREEFKDTITRAKSRCEAYAEERLYDRDGANGAKFSLSCNFGWKDSSEKSGDPAAFAALISAIKGNDNAP